jgi:hypothetical protein
MIGDLIAIINIQSAVTKSILTIYMFAVARRMCSEKLVDYNTFIFAIWQTLIGFPRNCLELSINHHCSCGGRESLPVGNIERLELGEGNSAASFRIEMVECELERQGELGIAPN